MHLTTLAVHRSHTERSDYRLLSPPHLTNLCSPVSSTVDQFVNEVAPEYPEHAKINHPRPLADWTQCDNELKLIPTINHAKSHDNPFDHRDFSPAFHFDLSATLCNGAISGNQRLIRVQACT